MTLHTMSGAQTNTVVIFSRYLPNLGGVEFFTTNLARQLASMGIDVLIVTTDPSDDPAADARQHVGEGSIEVLRLHPFGPQRMPFVCRDGCYRQILARLKGLAPFDALINTRFYDLSAIAARLCRNLGIKPVLIDHGTGYIEFSNKVLSLISMHAEHVITANLKRFPIDYYGVSQDSSKWLATFGIVSCGEIHNALDATSFVASQSGLDFMERYGVQQGTLCVVYAARLLPEKGADVLLEAARLLEGDGRLHFFVAGSGLLEQEFASASESLSNLTYLGRLTHPDLAALLLQSDVFCFPSRYCEGLPTSLLEAAACRNVLIYSRAGGVDEIIPTANHGVILDEPTTPAVVQTLTELADNPERVDTLKQTAYEHVSQHFTWKSTAREALAAFAHAKR